MPRVLTSDQWADYLIYRLYPQQRVFFDGRSDFFGPAIGSDYRKLLAGERPWRELLDRYQFDLALLPRDWALSTALEREPGWRQVYQDSVAVLYVTRRGAVPGPRTRRESAAAGDGAPSMRRRSAAMIRYDGPGAYPRCPRDFGRSRCHDRRHRNRSRPRSGRSR